MRPPSSLALATPQGGRPPAARQSRFRGGKLGWGCFLIGFGWAQAQPQEPQATPWVEAARQGITRSVIVPTVLARDREAYGRQIALLCQGPSSCFLNFYTNTKGLPLGEPLPDEIWHEPTAVYRKSTKQGAELFRFSCRLGIDTVNCF